MAGRNPQSAIRNPQLSRLARLVLRWFSANPPGLPLRRPPGPHPQSAIPNPQLSRLARLLLDWFSANARDLPWRRTRDPYAIWVSEIMLQQTQVKTVIPYWDRWMRELPPIRAAANA